MSLKIRFLGGTREIGRIAIAIKTDKTQVLLDYGVLFDHEPGFPMHVPPKEVDALVLTHAHLDHSGALPIFHIHGRKPVYGTQVSFDLAELLIADFIHLSSYYLPFEYVELRSTLRSCVNVNYGEEVTIGDLKMRLLDAGHIPGSAQVLIEADGKRVLYTGDYNTIETRLLPEAEKDYGELDVVIIESTYADEEHPERQGLEKEFVERVVEVVEKGGTVLVPAFSVGRSQEIACVLAAHNFKHPITVDGMTRKVNRLLMNRLKYVRDSRLFMDAMHATTWVESERDRKIASQKPGVIISPAGMLKGGPAASYVQRVAKHSGNAIFLVSYQIPGTPGRVLLEKHRCLINGKLQRAKSQVEHFDFSSHCGTSELQETIKNLKGNPKVYVVHGAEGNCKRFANWIQSETEFDAVAPKAGDTFTV